MVKAFAWMLVVIVATTIWLEYAGMPAWLGLAAMLAAAYFAVVFLNGVSATDMVRRDPRRERNRRK